MPFTRHLTPSLISGLEFSPVVLVTGPRQAGKTTLVQLLGEQRKFHYVSFDDVAEQAAALQDPVSYIARQPKPVILDEVQRVPEIFLPVKRDVDKHRIPGRYLFTGSVNPLLVPKLGDALTGRMAIHQLWPLSQGEIQGTQESFLQRAFSADFGQSATFPCSRSEIIERLKLGGFPSMHLATTQKQRRSWCSSYLSGALQKDIHELAHIEKLAQLPNLLQLFATRIGSLLNYADLGNGASIPVTTLRRYVQLLHSLFLLFTLPPWNKSLSQRLVKSSKVYFVDTAILLHILGLDIAKIEAMPALLGGFFENFVVMELCKQISWHDEQMGIYHFRTSNRAEVDIVLENEYGQIVGIEVKSSETVRSDDFKHFAALREAADKDYLRGIVLYSGNRMLPFGPENWAVPISALWL